jgi:predicted DNA-binding protein (UPF0251 family)
VPSKLPQDKILVNLYNKKRLTLEQIGERYGVSRQRVHQRLSALGVGRISRKVVLDADTLRSLYVESRLDTDKIAARLKVSKNQVVCELRRHGIKRPPVREYLASVYSQAEVARLYITEGLLQADAAARLGIATRSFRDLLVQYGITYRHAGLPPKIEIPERELRRLYMKDRHTAQAIAEIYGCSDDTVLCRLRSLGIPVERGRREPK